MKQKRSNKKYGYDTSLAESIPNQVHLAEMREQLRQALEQLQQFKLSIELESQKKILAEHQFQQSKEQNLQLRSQLEQVKKQVYKLGKKYTKLKEQQKVCEKYKEQKQMRELVDREREVFMKERNVLKNQIKQLKNLIQTYETRDSTTITLAGNAKLQEKMKRQLDDRSRTIEEQKKVIRFLDQKLSIFEIQKLQTLTYVESIDQKMQELQMENIILKDKNYGTKKRSYIENIRERPPTFLQSPNRKNGSIKNLEKLNKSRSRD